ncbi:GTPase [Novosphingobium sediminis]|uniref:GTPase n=1 Tax=Novosphingobium sediminis TaxID=707214 RepID=A0A512APT4_9SPHN|nr:GTPase [Novosphingobium sediminis]GEO01716.1 GTPase [Novosphingobium sediminis]
MPIETVNIANIVQSAVEKAFSERGFVNVLVIGKTGTGKSTLVNAVFNGRIAETGQGRPVTQRMKRYTKEGSPVSIYDTKGLEVADYKGILNDLRTKVREINRSDRPEEHIHVAWLCIAEGARRIEAAELELMKVLEDIDVPVVVAITTAVSDQGFQAQVREAFHSASNVVRVNSEPYVMDEAAVIPVKGLDVLVDVTMEVVPEGQKSALAAAQRVKVDHKVARSHSVVATAAALAMGAGGVPVPFSDAAAIVPVQVGMIASISAIFGLNVTTGFLTTLVTSSLGSTTGTLAGRALVGSLLKLIPGAGSIVGGVVSASVAGALTTAFGEAYIAVLKQLTTENPDRELSAHEIAQALKDRLTVSRS